MNIIMRNDIYELEEARRNMIEQQIRPWEVLDANILELLIHVPREQFVPPHLRSLAFVDFELPLNIDGVASGETMLAPKVEARLLQELGIHANEKVLEIGTGSGYMAALAAHRAQTVWSVEIDPRLAAFASANLARAGVRNAHVEVGDGAQGSNSAVCRTVAACHCGRGPGKCAKSTNCDQIERAVFFVEYVDRISSRTTCRTALNKDSC